MPTKVTMTKSELLSCFSEDMANRVELLMEGFHEEGFDSEGYNFTLTTGNDAKWVIFQGSSLKDSPWVLTVRDGD